MVDQFFVVDEPASRVEASLLCCCLGREARRVYFRCYFKEQILPPVDNLANLYRRDAGPGQLVDDSVDGPSLGQVLKGLIAHANVETCVVTA